MVQICHAQEKFGNLILQFDSDCLKCIMASLSPAMLKELQYINTAFKAQIYIPRRKCCVEVPEEVALKKSIWKVAAALVWPGPPVGRHTSTCSH